MGHGSLLRIPKARGRITAELFCFLDCLGFRGHVVPVLEEEGTLRERKKTGLIYSRFVELAESQGDVGPGALELI